jgi:hypothetical protein
MTGVDLVETFLKVLPSECLRENLNSLIIGLYPIIERGNQDNIWLCFHEKKPDVPIPIHPFSESSEAFLFDVPEQSTPVVSLVCF